MAFFRAMATLDALSGNTEDVNVTSFFAEFPTQPNSLQVADWGDAIVDFFGAVRVAGALRGRATGGHDIKFYAADGSVPNYPFEERAFSLGVAPGDYVLPSEVSLCVSYANDTENSVQRARRRGRIYISGWNSTNNSTGRPTTATTEDLADAFQVYAQAVNVITDATAVVYSRTNVIGYALERTWVDNEWDTMRSRGGKSTARETRSI